MRVLVFYVIALALMGATTLTVAHVRLLIKGERPGRTD